MTSAPVVPRPAATVLLLRDHPDAPPGRAPLQVFLQRRVAGMAFAGGMTVFPGGAVDAADVPDPQLWAGPAPDWWAARLQCPTALAGALVQAAVRETFEECGVLLAAAPHPGADLDAQLLSAGRADIVARRRSLGELLRGAGLQLRADLLRPWARWITPESEPRRYDTAFFVALVPDGQAADAHTTEAVEATWWHPDEALACAERGEIRLMTPTEHTLREIAALPDSAAVLAAADGRTVRAVAPRVVQRDGRRVVLLPGDPAYLDPADPAAGDVVPEAPS